MIVTNDDFVGDAFIALSTPNGGDAAKLTNIINLYETDYVIELLGEMYGDFITNNNDAKYQDLINGGNFITDDGVSIPFVGLRTILVYRLYSVFKRNDNSHSSTVGELKMSNIAAIHSDNTTKIVNAFNRYVDLVGTPNDIKYRATLYNFLSNGDYEN